MNKIKINNNAYIYPMPMALLGTMTNDLPNFMGVAWVNRVNASPPLVMASINKDTLTHRSILENNAFSINFPSAQYVTETDYCSIYSANHRNKSNIFDVFYGELDDVPMIEVCPLNFECRLYDTKVLPTNTIFIGEIVASYTEEKYLKKGNPDIKRMNLFMLTMPDNNYWRVGSSFAKAWDVGMKV